MALDKQQWEEVTAAMKKLRGLGCAVCVFTPDDVESAAANEDREMDPDGAVDWIDDNRKHLEDGMSTWGNAYIADNL